MYVRYFDITIFTIVEHAPFGSRYRPCFSTDSTQEVIPRRTYRYSWRLELTSEASSANSRSVSVFRNGIHFISYHLREWHECTMTDCKELTLIIIATTVTLTPPTSTLSPWRTSNLFGRIPHSPRYWCCCWSPHGSLYHLWPLEHPQSVHIFQPGMGKFRWQFGDDYRFVVIQSAMERRGGKSNVERGRQILLDRFNHSTDIYG